MPIESRPANHALAITVLAGLVLPGCVSLPTADELRQAPAPHLDAAAPPGIVDGRAAFRVHFCESLAEYPEDSGPPAACDFWLHRLEDEPAGPAAARRIAAAPMQVLLVTGAFSECFGEEALPFGSALASLRGSGIRIDTTVVGGRSGTEHNAREIAAHLAAWPVHPDIPLTLIGYSKGTIDILQFLVDFPEAARQVDAVVSVAGSVGGSPLADEFEGLYEFLFSHLPSGHCPPGDGDVVHGLRTDVRDAWLHENELPASIDYYSIAAFTTHDRVAWSLAVSWKTLLKHERRNDGQVLAHDALIPGSTLLGYLDADHWAVALDIEDESPLLAHRDEEAQFPHRALLHAILRQVAVD
jgi:hypothetical protein